MESTEALKEVRLGPAQLPGCVALVTEARWNQNAEDWRTMLALGQGFGLEAADGTLVATSLALPFPGGGFGWISMVLVTEQWRRRGLASRLMQRAMDFLSARGLSAILDATPAGRAVYGLLDFRDTWGIERMQCLQAPHLPPAPKITVRALRDADWNEVRALDAAAFAADRSGLLQALRPRLPAAALVAERDERISGFLLGRNGRVANQLGPCVAADQETAIALLDAALRTVSAPVFLDVPASHESVGAWLRAAGFTLQRPYTRMILGRDKPYNDVGSMYAIAGPELG